MTNNDVPLRADARSAEPTERRLSQLEDFEVADGFPDIRGWPARGSNGRELGIVGEMLVDTGQMEVTAVEVHLGVGAAGIRGNTVASTRVPIESLQLRPDRYVIVDVAAVPCVDMPQYVEGAGTMAEGTRRVPCGQIGIKRRSGTDGRPVLPPLAEPDATRTN